MNKKGFTLIEIIISIGLILLISGTSTVIYINNKSNSNLDIVTKKVLETAKVFVNVEKDENGISYENGIQKGSKGVYISIQNLFDKGYINSSQVETLEKNTKKKSNELLILASINSSVFPDDSNECSSGLISFTPSWNTNLKTPIYLCGYNENNHNNNSTLFSKIQNSEYTICKDDSNQNVLCMLTGKNTSDKNSDGTESPIYYFKNNVNNNYIKIGDTIFRIVRTVEDNNIKIIINSNDDRISSLNLTENSHILADISDSSFVDAGNQIVIGVSINKNTLSFFDDDKNHILKYCSSSSFSGDNNWSNDVTYTSSNCKTRSSGSSDSFLSSVTIKIKNPYFFYYYQKLNEVWENKYKTLLKDLVVDNYKWCETSTKTSDEYSSEISYKCGEEKVLESNIGLLNRFEYEFASGKERMKIKGCGNNAISDSCEGDNYLFDRLINSSGLGIYSSDLTMDFIDGINFVGGIYPTRNGYSSATMYLAPTFVIKGTTIVNGSGTKSDPYVIAN